MYRVGALQTRAPRYPVRMSALSSLVLVLLACSSDPAPQAVPAPEPTPAAGAVESAELRALLQESWDATMAHSPTWATELGDHRFDAVLGDPSRASVEAFRDRQRAWKSRAEALPPTELTPADRRTRDLFAQGLSGRLETAACRYELWSLSARRNVLGDANYLAELHVVHTPEDGANLVSRYRALVPVVDATVANLRAGLAQGLVPNATSVTRVVQMLDTQLAKPDAEWPLLDPLEAERTWPEGAHEAWSAELSAAVGTAIRPALERYRAVLHDEILPAARDDAAPGLASVPGGSACYAAEIERHTTLERPAAELHQTGLDELERIHAELRTLGARQLGTDDLAQILARLRTDPALRFETEEQVRGAAVEALAAARAAMPQWFGRLPQADCVVEDVPAYEAPFTTIAYYRQPTPEGGRPGTYFINVYAPETRPRPEARVLAFHESIPGHHLQIAIAQELPDLPSFRRHGGFTAFVEGWALYSERLSDEMGLYRDDLDRLGVLSFDAWRAARLVVDTGLHDQGWSRERAVAFMLANTPLAANNIDNEVDRYITTPGQALAYKVGQLEILRLRAEAEAALGDRFDIKGFHDAVLAQGPVTLPVLEAQVRAWVEGER